MKRSFSVLYYIFIMLTIRIGDRIRKKQTKAIFVLSLFQNRPCGSSYGDFSAKKWFKTAKE
ncbi:hypothetical protein [Leptospira santarosai]|nr:hypothetical protein [Leptospira santarosai]